jgi:hypothetical protein
MSASFTEHKTVQQRILDYANEVGWEAIPRSKAEELRHFDTSASLPQERIKGSSLFFKDILIEKLKEFNPKLINPEDIVTQLSLLRYRVKSKRGTQFRIWANKVLKEYLVKGYP